jgi:site-specific DNA-methyltransferase (adenine-specific)
MSGKYRTIVADPPWSYDDGFPQGPAHGVRRATVKLPYPSMSATEVAALPVPEWCERDCWLFLWTTNRYLPDSFSIVEAWGFRYTQTITWRKTGCPSPFVRSVAPQHSEFLLVGRRGHPRRDGSFPTSVIDAPAQSRHSAKPEVFMDYVEAVGEGPRLEMFARRNRLGWDTWGNEALEHVTMGAAK